VQGPPPEKVTKSDALVRLYAKLTNDPVGFFRHARIVVTESCPRGFPYGNGTH